MTPRITPGQWATAIDEGDPPAFGEVVQVLEELAEYLRLNPDATAIEAVGHVGADPARWIDPVEDALAADRPHAALATPAEEDGRTDTDPAREELDVDPDGTDADTDGSPTHAEEDPAPDRSTPGVDAGGSGSATTEPTDDADLNQQPTPEDPPVLVNDDAPIGWGDADFTTTRPNTYPPALLDREQWMGRAGEDEKLPFAPWGDKDPDDADPDDSPRWEWGRTENYVDGDTVAIAEDDPRLDGRAFIQLESDPFAFVDGDDVRDPDTDEVHPDFIAILDDLGFTYADISTSGGGVHAYYRGDLPRDLPEAKFTIDSEPWGSNDDEPAVEIYANKHVCVATGDRVGGAPLELAEWDDDALKDVLDDYDELPEEPRSTDPEDYDLDDYEPKATGSGETTDDIRDIFRALDQLDPKRVGERTIVREWTRERRSFLPVWGSSDDSGTANYIDDRIWHDTGHDGGYGGPVVMAAIDAGLINHTGATPADVRGETFFKAVDHLRDLGFDIPELVDPDPESDQYDDDPRETAVTVDPRRAWDAAGRVEPSDLADDRLTAGEGDAFACPGCSAGVDVVRAVAVEEGLVETCDAPLDDAYPEAYRLAREEYGAPLPEYYTTTDAIAEFDAVLDVIGEVSFFHLDTDALATEVTATDDDVDGEAVRALNPSWRESESEESVIVFDSGTIWDADTERVLDVLRFVALDSGLLDDPREALEGSDFTEAYGLARTEYGAPLPRWEPAEDGARAVTPQLPPSEELVDARDLDGVDPDALEVAREDVEALTAEATDDADTPTVVTALPATGKTTGMVKTAGERPLSYLAPRKELQQQALDKAERWGVDAEVLPVFAEATVADEVLNAAVAHVREYGKDRLRDRWSIIAAATDAADEDDDSGEIFVEDNDEDDADLDRGTCPTAEGAHGDAWALDVHVARRLGYTPQEIHTQARGLFGADLPCTDAHGEGDTDACEYGAAWDDIADPDDPPDLLVGSYIHAHVESVRTAYSRNPNGTVDRAPRAIVLDEFVGEAFTREFGEEALDFATWLARCLREDVDDRRDMASGDLWGDEWVRAWLDGSGEDVDAVDDAIGAIARVGDLLDAREVAAGIDSDVDAEVLEALGLKRPLQRIADPDADAAEAFDTLDAALAAVDREHPAAGVAEWVRDSVHEPLGRATVNGSANPSVDSVDTDELPIDGDLLALVEDALDTARERREGARDAIDAAVTALRGGRDGCRRLAAWADDGYAHPDAHYLLANVVTPTGDDSDEPGARRIHTSEWAFDPEATDGTVADVVENTDRVRTVVDRNDHGAILHTPPARTAGGGADVPLVGLDATGRAELWANALGEPVDTVDIHDTPAERAAFMEDALGLRVLQASDLPRPYEGSPASKDTDGDVALLEALADEYTGIEAPRERGDAPTEVGRPAAITTKGVREVLENDPRLDDVVAEWENYGNLTGDNDLGAHRLAAILGSQHYGDHAIERFCALAGEEVDTERRGGRGAELDYGSDLANAYLAHMREDQTMQAILRFTRGDSGATVVARTSALREDLPVVGRAQVVETWSETARAIAKQYRRLGEAFTVADVADAVDVSKRQVRRVLGELADAGYLRRVEAGDGVASVYEADSTPSAGEVDLPGRGGAVDATAGHTATNEYYTWNVRVRGGGEGYTPPDSPGEIRSHGAPPAPGTVPGGGPPG